MALRATTCLCMLLLVLGLSITASAQKVAQTNLVSDQAGVANNQDILLINAFGFARGTGTNWMVAAKGSAQGIEYDGFGNPQFINVNTPPAAAGGQGQPTGVVFNGTTSFNVPGSNVPAQFLFATADGLIEAFNPNVDSANAKIAVNNSATSCYTGLTIAEVSPGVFHLYAANFKKGTVDVFDGNFKPVKFPARDFDSDSDLELAPYNVQVLGPNLVTTYAAVGSSGQVVTGDGNGLVVITDFNGHSSKVLSGSSLNAPWGIAEAPADFGRLSHAVLIGNSGSGKIAAFEPFRGKFLHFVEDATGAPLVIDGLRALGFGATGAAGDPSFTAQTGAYNALYFTAGPVGGTHGLIGTEVPLNTEFVLGEQ